MKEGYIIESGGLPTKEELEKINKFARRPLKAEELYVFSVVLCDNEIDRDFERFSTDALEKMAPMFVGKTGIFDHSGKAHDQIARIFDCEAEMVTGALTKRGEPYCRLKARVYTLNCESNKDFILGLDAGITKEVSVGCSMGSSYCSICATDRRNGHCEHKKGRFYRKNGVKYLCHNILDNPLDAFEWSFVAVPAQPKAGVIKNFTGKGGITFGSEEPLTDCIKNYSSSEAVVLSSDQVKDLADTIGELQRLAEDGFEYKSFLKKEISRLGALLYPDMDDLFYSKAASIMSVEELARTKDSLTKQLDGIYPLSLQLDVKKEDTKKPLNQNYCI